MNDLYTKLAGLQNWLDYQEYSFVTRIKTLSDAEKLFNYCLNHKVAEFLDDIEIYEEDEQKEIKEEVNKLIGYNLIR